MTSRLRASWGLVVVAGCGRIGFVGGGDADGVCLSPVGHDEDGDGIDDACDGCPHIADPAQIDTDRDGVDDLCDPDPSSPRQRIAYFDPFTSLRSEWTVGGAPIVADDHVTFDGRGSRFGMSLDIVPTADVFTIGGRVGPGGNGQRQIIVAAYETPTKYYYCEIEGNSSPMAALGATYTLDGLSFPSLSTIPAQGPIENHDYSLTMAQVNPMFTCATTWPADQDSAPGTTQAIAPVRIEIGGQGISLTIDYFLQIRTD